MASNLPLFPAAFFPAPLSQPIPSSFLNLWDTSASSAPLPDGRDLSLPAPMQVRPQCCPASPAGSHMSASFDIDSDGSSVPSPPPRPGTDRFGSGSAGCRNPSSHSPPHHHHTDPLHVLPVFLYPGNGSGQPSSSGRERERRQSQSHSRRHSLVPQVHPGDSYGSSASAYPPGYASAYASSSTHASSSSSAYAYPAGSHASQALPYNYPSSSRAQPQPQAQPRAQAQGPSSSHSRQQQFQYPQPLPQSSSHHQPSLSSYVAYPAPPHLASPSAFNPGYYNAAHSDSHPSPQSRSHPSSNTHTHQRRLSTTTTASSDTRRPESLCDIDEIALRDPDDRSDVVNFIARTSPLFAHTHTGSSSPSSGHSSPQPHSPSGDKPDRPCRADVNSILSYAFRYRPPTSVITRADLRSGILDAQGINWTALQTSRQMARASRYADYFRHEQPLARTVPPLPTGYPYYRFDSMYSHAGVTIPHFQLRNLVALTSHSDLYYGAGACVMHCNLINFHCRPVLNLTGPNSLPRTNRRVTCIAAGHGLLMAVGLHGEYTLIRLGSSVNWAQPELSGAVTSYAEDSGINHVDVYLTMSSDYPRAAMCLNNGKLSILDCLRNQVVNQFTLPGSVNCSAGSPDGRLRCVVGDWATPLIIDCASQSSSRVVHELESHGGSDGFACAWSDNSMYVATGGEDGTVKIYDVRQWPRPVKRFSTHMGPARSLNFSSWNNDRSEPVLAVAEADDYISIVERSWNRQQVLDGFGAIGGLAFDTYGDNDLYVANGDPNVGGLTKWVVAEEGEKVYKQGMSHHQLAAAPITGRGKGSSSGGGGDSTGRGKGKKSGDGVFSLRDSFII